MTTWTPKVAPAVYEGARLRRELIADFAAVAAGDAVLVDARSPGRFQGDVPEPAGGTLHSPPPASPGARGCVSGASGAIPGSVNLPYSELVEGGLFKPVDQLKALFLSRGIEPSRPLITTCGALSSAARPRPGLTVD